MTTIEKATCKTCGFYENNCPFIRGKFIPYPNKVCKDYTFSTLKAEQEPVSDDLEEAAEKHASSVEGDYAFSEGPDHYCSGDLEDAFKAGAKWQARQLLQGSPMPEDTLIFRKGVEEGRRLEREDIENEWLEDRGGCFWDGVNEGKKAMKDAVEGEVVKKMQGDYYVTAKLPSDRGYGFGDKVRIIILPKEDGE